MSKRRIGIFGGSFDPVHQGHLLIAEQFAQDMRLDVVKFIPAKISPFKLGYTPTSDKHRLEMLRLAIGSNKRFEVDALELDRGGVSYTMDTVAALRGVEPDAEYYMLIGADSLRDFKKWKSPEELLVSVSLVVARRGGEAPPQWSELAGLATPEVLGAIQERVLDLPAMEVSSTDIRRRVEQGRSIRYLVPSGVEVYIHSHGLYRPTQGE
jgi:nicotinate-nucleotide adenylyltransferase